MTKKQTQKEIEPSTIETAVLSPDAQTLHDFKLSLFIVSVTINFLLFIFWLTVQFVAIHG